jgi:hypothetical protein
VRRDLRREGHCAKKNSEEEEEGEHLKERRRAPCGGEAATLN